MTTSGPYQNSAGEKIDLITEALVRLVLRMLKETIPREELKEPLIAPVRQATEIIQDAA